MKIKHCSSARSFSARSFLVFSFLLLISSFSLANVKEMDRLIMEQNFQEAYQFGHQLLAEEAGNPSFDLLYGLAAFRVAEYSQAQFAFERVLMFDPNATVPRYELARTHFLLGNLIAARRHFNLVLENKQKPPLEIQKNIQWYLTTMNAKEAGKVIATINATNRFYIDARFGYDSNPRNMTHLDVFLPLANRFINDGLPDIDSDTFHEMTVGASRLQQQTNRWGWFIAGNAGLKGYHNNQKSLDNYSLALQGGGILLGSNWRLSLPLQASKQVRKDKNEVLVLAAAINFNQRLSSQADYSVFTQLAAIESESNSSSTDVVSYTLGTSYFYRLNENLKLNAGPMLSTENPKVGTAAHNGRNVYGIRTGLDYTFNDDQRLDLNFSYLSAKHKVGDPSFNDERRKDDLTNLGLKFSQRFSNNWLVDLGIQRSNNRSTLNLYSYRRTQLNAGIRKEW